MKIYYLRFTIKPAAGNKDFGIIEGADAHFWIKTSDPDAAYQCALDYLQKSPWLIVSLEQSPIETTEEQHRGKDIGINKFRLAQIDGISVAITAWLTGDNKTEIFH